MTPDHPAGDSDSEADEDRTEPEGARDETAEASAGAHDWPVLETAVEYETGWYDGGYDLVEQPDGSRKPYYWAELPDAVVVVAIDDDHLVMVDQYRPTIRAQCLELPAGIVEDGESYETAGARELREETGYEPDAVAHLQTMWCATGVLRHRRAHVVAEGLSAVGEDLDENEFLEVRRVPVADALARARDEPANDATIEGLLLAEADGFL